MSIPCNVCKGLGKITESYNINATPCATCSGAGVVRHAIAINQLMLEALKKIVAESGTNMGEWLGVNPLFLPAEYLAIHDLREIAQVAIDAVEGGGVK